MPTCTFCKKNFKEPKGLTIFTFDGRAIHFCSSKCRRNMQHLKRDPKKTNWVRKRADNKISLEKAPKENSLEKSE
jgi:large subunit ribosomal protein L24e